jgi:oxygen-independent coproporphyrinogen III oxidase
MSSLETLPPKAAYIHVPFCHHRCPYCNFTVTVERADWIQRYLKCLETELAWLGPAKKDVDTIFIGGGTPTLLDDSALEKLLNSLTTHLRLSQNGEWSIEANPNDLSEAKCRLLKAAGINRISIGGQSFNDAKLKQLGRNHSGQSLIEAIALCQEYFDNVSLDLIFGVPGESLATWQRDLDRAIALELKHVSTYGLTYEKGAAFWSQLQKGELRAVDEGDELAMYINAIDSLSSAGMEHYEVSNFARPTFQCRHNQTYWTMQPWYALGPGAAGFLNGKRTLNHRSTIKYLQLVEANQSPIIEAEAIDGAQLTRERFVFGMRLLRGVDLSLLSIEGEPEILSMIRSTIEKHVAAKWLIQEGSNVRLTPQGLTISDSLWPEYL